MDVRVLIVAPDDRLAGPLAEGLDRVGWRSITARGAEAALAALRDLHIEVVIVETGDNALDGLALAQALKAARTPRRLPVVALGRPDPLLEQMGFDLALSPPLHPAQAVLRLEALVRAAVAEEEFELRRETLAERGRTLVAPPSSPQPLKVLTIGEPAPKFVALAHALTAMGAEATAALTAYTAFDYMHEEPFDAVVLWAGETHAEALSIAGGMRRNTRLFHIPTILYLRAGAEVELADAFNRGLADVATADTPAEDTARRVISLARAYRRETAIRQALEQARSSGLMDAATGLFTGELFAAHLSRLARASRERGRDLSVAVLRIADRPETTIARHKGWLDRAIPQIGSMIGRLVRAEDTAARLAPEVFALALPAAAAGAGRIAAERIAAVIACTAFEAGDGRPPFTIEFELGVAELEPGETAARTLERAAARAAPRQTA
ncbi:MAG TPA: diguanylate cyclase [Caulobacteraceae bacterium]|jgi:two-component system cell cycle response regulator PopA|nr:diguanylate cyclase [Caulobacteraceae bacterium]